jgi:hypothetical protein
MTERGSFRQGFIKYKWSWVARDRHALNCPNIQEIKEFIEFG